MLSPKETKKWPEKPKVSIKSQSTLKKKKGAFSKEKVVHWNIDETPEAFPFLKKDFKPRFFLKKLGKSQALFSI